MNHSRPKGGAKARGRTIIQAAAKERPKTQSKQGPKSYPPKTRPNAGPRARPKNLQGTPAQSKADAKFTTIK